MWRLGGLSPLELLKRTARESWEDDIFGLAARLAFYHFLAVFPVLCLILVPLAHLAGAGADMRATLAGSIRQFMPADAASLVAAAIQDLNSNAHKDGILVVAALGAIWAGLNASWAMIQGLNAAYETEEDRGWRKITATAAALALALVALVVAALFVSHYLRERTSPAALGAFLPRAAEWAAIVAILMLSFALFYRFGPNLEERRWQWSTPGAVFGVLLWVGATLATQQYFDHFSSHHRIYGRLAATAALLIWLYMTSATVLIGAELNSEIEKADEHGGVQRAVRKPRAHRPDPAARRV